MFVQWYSARASYPLRPKLAPPLRTSVDRMLFRPVRSRNIGDLLSS